MISTFFYRNPRLLIMALVLVIASGVGAFINSPRLEDPVLSKRVAVVSISYPGANTDRVDSLVTTKIEHAIRSIAEIKTIQARSRPGISLIKLELRDSVLDIPEVWSRVRDKIEQAESTLPEQALPPEIRIAEMKSYAAMVALTSRSGDPADFFTLRRIAFDLQAKIDRLAGTERTRIYGDPGEEVVVEVDVNKLALTGLTVGSLSQQIEKSQPRHPAGTLMQDQIERPITYGDQFDSLAGLKETIIKLRGDDESIKLSDLAKVTIQSESKPINAALIDEQSAIVICSYVRDDFRVDRWSDSLDRVLLDLKKQLPEDVRLNVIFSQRPFVEHRMVQLLSNLLLGMLAVMIVIILMMDWRSATVIGLALPLTALIVLAGLRLLKIPIHQMSITGLVIALGLLIDNAIVMVDECRQRMRSGLSISTAIDQAVKHLTMPLLCSTLTTTLAFLPIAMLPGPPGEFVGTIAVSVILAINASLLLALTVVPALIGMFSGKPNENTGQTRQAVGLSIPLFAKMYRRSIFIVCQHPILGLMVGIGLPILGFVQANQLPEQFFPASDRNQIQVEVELPVGTSQQQTRDVIKSLNEQIKSEPGVLHTNWFIGESAPSFYYNIVPRRQHAAYYAQAFLDLASGLNTSRFVRDMQTKLSQSNHDARILVRQLEQGPPVDAPVEILIKGPDLRVLEQLGTELRQTLSETPDVIYTRSDLGEVTTSLELNFDEDKLNASGLSRSDVTRQLYAALEGVEAGTIRHREYVIPVMVRIAETEEMDLDQLQGLIIQPTRPRMSERGKIITSEGPPLSAIADFQ
ncbi:MAG: efflux RND transporter permease subunit, partial [Planctomycetes bacterium]|nr:efflux RND transporter permease subunit [Planctomycetota bacterium]